MNNIPKYKSTPPTKWEARFDKLFSVITPGYALNRMVNREKMNRLRYQSAIGNRTRPQNGPNSGSGETQMGNRERQMMMWNAIDLIENSGLAWRIRNKFCDYVCGQLRYQARTGDAATNTEYESYLKDRLGRNLDINGRKTIRQFGRLAVSGMVVKGDAGIVPVRQGEDIRLQGIEADRIGHPYDYKAARNYIGGVHLTDWGRHEAYDIFTKDRMNGQYYFEETVPARNGIGLPNFFLCANPITFDDVRGRTAFKATINNAAYIDKLREFELQALVWAASQSGIYYTKSGGLPDDLPFKTNADRADANGNTLSSFTVEPNTVQALDTAEDIKMFQHDRPSPNVMAMYRETIRDICNGVDLSYQLVYDWSGVSGPGVRGASTQDKRSLDTWKEQLGDDLLYPLVYIILGNGIACGHIRPHKNWMKGQFIFPPHPTIDIGRESAANINEYAAALASGADIAGEAGLDIEEVQEQCGIEAQRIIQIAKKIAKQEGCDWREVLPMIRKGGAIIMSPAFEAARAEQLEAAAQQAVATADEKDATTAGVELE